MDPNEAFVQTIRAEMSAQRMTQEQLADAAKVPLSSLKNYLLMKSVLRLDVLNAIGAALGLTPRELLQLAVERMDRAEASSN